MNKIEIQIYLITQILFIYLIFQLIVRQVLLPVTCLQQMINQKYNSHPFYQYQSRVQ